MQEYHTRTCIRWEPRAGQDGDYVFIGKIDGCFSDVGRAGGRQEISLAQGCLEYDTAIHELMHAVGFYHEHERWDRDQYIDIQWQNIDRGGVCGACTRTKCGDDHADAYDQFGRVDLTESSYYDQPYDYFSVMHYDREAFSKNGQDTIKTRDTRYNHLIGQALDFSAVDLAKINFMYECSSKPVVCQHVHAPFSACAHVGSAVRSNARLGNDRTSTTVACRTSISCRRHYHIAYEIHLDLIQLNISVTETCRDQASLCWKWLDRCSSQFFDRIMREFCALSCGFCTPSGTVQ
jgi:hypothetical protein